jgi:hypothetical protein
MKKQRWLTAVFAVIAIFLPSACEDSPKDEFPKSLEETRVTSSNGLLDAVLIREGYGGGAGGFEWSVYIVSHGKAVTKDYTHQIFQAATLTGEKLVWSQPHLLEIHYSIANIEQFRNLWDLSEVRNVGSQGEYDYLVEVRLVPSSPNFSLLTPDGGFKPKEYP